MTKAIPKLLIKKSSRMSRGRMFGVKFEKLVLTDLFYIANVKYINFILNAV
jgi:hypothetical protein